MELNKIVEELIKTGAQRVYESKKYLKLALEEKEYVYEQWAMYCAGYKFI